MGFLRVSKGQEGLLVCVRNRSSHFLKPLIDPERDAKCSTVKGQSGYNYNTIYDALPLDRFLCQWLLTTAPRDMC